MKDVMEHIGTLYHPKTALVFYEAKGTNAEVYVEYFDMDRNGSPINAHPLTTKEAVDSARLFHPHSVFYFHPYSGGSFHPFVRWVIGEEWEQFMQV